MCPVNQNLDQPRKEEIKMIFERKPSPLSVKTKRRILENLARSLDKEYIRQMNAAAKSTKSPESLASLVKIAQAYNQVVAALDELLQAEDFAEQERSRLKFNLIYNYVLADLQPQIGEDYQARKAIFAALGLILQAEEKLNSHPTRTKGSEGKRIIIHTDLLYQAFLALFPAEKMMVASGRSVAETINLGALFDITGLASAGHVRADPDQLGRALIAMDNSDSFLAAWVHSHPGRGLSATLPSSIDQVQHQDWIQHYSSNLVSAILVEDGWIRFWGSALDNHQATIELVGSGITKEIENEWVYRFSG